MSRDGNLGLRVRYFDSVYQKKRNIYMCSKIAPIEQSKQWAMEHYREECSCFIIYGIGVGYHVLELKKRLKDRQKIVVIEANSTLYQWAKENGILERFEENGIMYKFIKSQQDLVAMLKDKNEVVTEIIGYKPSLELMPSELEKIREILEVYFMKKYYQDKLSDEIPAMYKYHESKKYDNISRWYNNIIHKPILIVSAGPSLSESLEEIKEIQNKVFIFATGRVLGMLVEAGIRVDMFCIIDPQEITYNQIKGMENLEVPFVFLNTVCVKTVEGYKGPKYIAYSMDSPENQEGRIETGGSVATAVMDLAIRFGAREILFVGQDLAFSNKQTHASECRGQKIDDVEMLRKVKAIDGLNLPTTMGLLSFKQWIEYKISRTRNVRFVNCTKIGAYIVGCEHMSLQNALQDLS